MSETRKVDSDPDTDALASVVADAARILVPLATMYLGPEAAKISRAAGGHDLGGAERRILMLALNKLVIDAGTLPAPGTAYAPHQAAFSIDAETGLGTALDLKYVLAAARGFAAWASAGPTPISSDARSEPPRTTTWLAPASAREMRTSARTRGYARTAATRTIMPSSPLAYVPATRSGTASSPAPRPGRSGGCGCSGSSSVSTRPAVTTRRPSRQTECHDPKPRCDCGGSCGGRGCGCGGNRSCTDCIRRGVPAADGCACTPVAPKAPERCEPWSLSCETRNRLKHCLKDALCDLLLCLEQGLCKGGSLDVAALARWRTELLRCFTDVFCRVVRCVREALCPPTEVPPPALPHPANDCLPCDFAVEDPR